MTAAYLVDCFFMIVKNLYQLSSIEKQPSFIQETQYLPVGKCFLILVMSLTMYENFWEGMKTCVFFLNPLSVSERQAFLRNVWRRAVWFGRASRCKGLKLIIPQTFSFAFFLKLLRVFESTCKYNQNFVVSMTLYIFFGSLPFFNHVMVTSPHSSTIKIMEIL